MDVWDRLGALHSLSVFVVRSKECLHGHGEVPPQRQAFSVSPRQPTNAHRHVRARFKPKAHTFYQSLKPRPHSQKTASDTFQATLLSEIAQPPTHIARLPGVS